MLKAASMRLGAGVALAVAVGCAAPPEALDAFHPLLVAEQAQVAFPQTGVGELVEARATYANPGSGVTRFTARLEPATSTVVLVDHSGAASPGSPGVLRLRFLALAPGTVNATLVVDHDGDAGPDGTHTLRTPVTAVTRAPPDCDDRNPCTLDQVDTGMPGGCSHLPMAGACDDGSACTTADRCESGLCIGTAVTCQDGVACTSDRCDPARGCVFEPVAAACDDGDPCTVDVCAAGLPGVDGCSHSLAPTGTMCGAPSCNTVSMCVAGVCSTMPTPEGFPCDDGDPCTRGDACQAGVCVPAEGTGTNLAEPVLLREVTNATTNECDFGTCGVPGVDGGMPPMPTLQEAPIQGHWPITVDAVGENINNALPQTLLVLWRGSDGPQAAGCYNNPELCHATPDCTQGIGTSTKLLLSTSDVTGTVFNTQFFPADLVYQRVRQVAGSAWDASPAPEHSVLAVSALPYFNKVVGAALVKFASTCGPCASGGPPNGGAPPADGGEAPTPPPACVPDGTALVVFEASADGFGVRTVRWFGRASLYSVENPPLLITKDGSPLLAAALAGSQLGISWATVLGGCPPNADCAALQDQESMVAHVLVMGASAEDDLDPNVPFETSIQHGIPWPGAHNNLGDVSLLGPEWRLTWTQRSQAIAPDARVSCVQDEWRDVWSLYFSGNDLYVNPMPGVTSIHGHTALGNAAFHRTRVAHIQPDDGCFVEETFAYEDGTRAVPPLVTFMEPQQSILGPATALMWNDQPLLLGPNQSGHWVMATPGQAHLETPLSPSWTTPWPGAMLARNTPVRATAQQGNVILAGLAEVGIYRGSLPTPALALSTLACRPNLFP